MCGIAGIFGNKELTKASLGQMLNAIVHRGPDDQGELYEEQFAFGMRRLSIIDLASGNQPIWNEDKTVAIVFNGEIYNFHELHDELVAKGHIFKTKSDTETIVHLYEEYGGITADMLNRLRGMFGFAIFDIPKNKISIARDQFGIKPLYYRITGPENSPKIESFGSEIKSLLSDTRYKPEVNHIAIHNYLSFQFNPLNETCFKNIFKLPPGSFMEVNLSDCSFVITKYWKYEFASDSKTRHDEEQLANEIREVMTDSVRHHMISDVPVGAFLSGGIDSAITVTLMQKEREKLGLDPVKTFTIGFEEVSEHIQAREVSDILKTDHHEIKVSFDEYFKELPLIAWHFDEPVADPSAVALYFLAREAKKEVKVVLSGEGSDELFGGYNIYREPFALAKIVNLPSWVKDYIVKPFTKLPFNFFGKNYLRRALTNFNNRYIGNAYIFKPAEVQKLWRKDIDPNIIPFINGHHAQPGIDLANPSSSESSNRPWISGYGPDFNNQSESRRMQLVDINYWMPGDILAKADKMTMAHSLELRVPYLDMEVAKISRTIGDELKYKEGKTKYILRKAFEPILPKTTADRKKLGFPTPIKHWLIKNPNEIMRLINNNPYIVQYFDQKYINELLENHVKGRADNARKIYTLLMLALWYNQFIDQL